MKRIYEFAIVFFLSLVADFIIFLPGLIPSGDVGQFATYVREIHLGGGSIPAINQFYYPGSEYIYPPALFYLSYILSIPFVSAQVTYFYSYSLLSIAIIFSSLTSVLVYSTGYPYIDRRHSAIAMVLVSLMGADIYSLPWGGYAYIFSQFFFLFLLVLLYNLRRGGANFRKYAAMSVLLSGMIAMSHDLTWAVTSYLMLLLTAYYWIRHEKTSFLFSLFSLVTSVVVGAIWWLPRLSFLLNTLRVSYSQGGGIFQTVPKPFTVVLSMIPSILEIGIILGFILLYAINSKRKAGFGNPFALSIIMLLPLSVFVFWDEVVAARIVLYLFPMFTAIICMNLPEFRELKIRIAGRYRKLSAGKVTAVLLVSVMILGPLQVYLDQGSAQFYSSGPFQYDQQLIDYGANATHFGNYTVLAPYFGQTLSAIDGVRIIIYEGFIFGEVQINERNAAIGILTDPGSNSSRLNITEYNIGFVIIPASWENSSVSGVYINLSQFTVVFSDQYYIVYKTGIAV